MEELLGWLFEGETRLVIFALIAAMLLVKWLVEPLVASPSRFARRDGSDEIVRAGQSHDGGAGGRCKP
jgi:uncharacterized membrane-anchored protein